jgi:hypothetical protein
MSDFNFPNIPDSGALMRQMSEINKSQRENANRLAGRYDAEEVFRNLMKRVKSFEAGLSEKEEIGLRLANFGEAAQIHIREISYQNPNLIEFHGVNPEDHEVLLVQHISQLNFLLVAVKPLEEKPFRMGFSK